MRVVNPLLGQDASAANVFKREPFPWSALPSFPKFYGPAPGRTQKKPSAEISCRIAARI